MFVECVSNIKSPEETILRLHFFDRQTTSYSSYSQVWSAASSSELGIIGKYANAQSSLKLAEAAKPDPSLTKEYKKWEELCKKREKRVTDYASKAQEQMNVFIKNGLVEDFKVMTKVEDDKGNAIQKSVSKYRVKGGPDQLRGLLAANMPTLKYGTEFSGILSAQLATQSNPAMETIHMQRQRTSSQPAGAVDAGLPMRIKPVELSLDCFGCPFINFGQQFFVDFQTNTTIDDIYAVSGVSHSLSPGEFKSQIKLSPLNKLGQFRSTTDSFADAMATAEEEGKK